MSVRVRFAWGPSGDVHIGNVRTVLFNWLFARHEGGKFIIRIEDTDKENSKPELFNRMYETLDWLGLDWDEGPDKGGPRGPYLQSERAPHHRELLTKLIGSGAVYRCYCTREDVVARGTKTGYDRYCRTHPREEDKPFALRFAVPDGDTVVRDVLRGDVVTAFDQMQDFVVARSDGSPTFVLANTADDIAMEITHVIRGTDLLPAAAQNTLLFRALGAEPPIYAHVPLVLGPDKSRLGARHGAVGTLAYRDSGFLPEALMNYLALVGWSSGDDQEIFSKDELVERFTLEGIQESAGVFDVKKLEWMNQQYIQKLSSDQFAQRVLEIAPETPVDLLRKVLELELIQTRVNTLLEVPDAIRYLHERPPVEPIADQPVLEEVADRLSKLDPWSPEAIKETIQGTIEELGLHRRKGPKPIFVAISGSDRALPLFESIFLIGREEAVARLRLASAP
ncbi:MAG: glutamate--tRNA ligase [Actinomycetota bacterium]